MASLARGRQALLDALNGAWEQVAAEVQAESRAEVERLSFQLLQEQATIRKLREEISDLKERAGRQRDEELIEDTSATKANSDHNQRQRQPETDGAHEWKDRHHVVYAKYQALKSEFAKAKELLRSRTESRREWISYADWLEAQVKSANGAEESIQKPSRNDAPPAIEEQIQDRGPSLGPQRPDVSFSSNSDVDAIEAVPLGPASVGAQKEESRLPPLPATDDAPEPPHIGPVPDSDEPVVVSSRVVRKRKLPEELAEARARRIKLERLDSTPEPVHRIDSLETVMDLDNSIHMITPRRRQPGHTALPAEPVSPSRNRWHESDVEEISSNRVGSKRRSSDAPQLPPEALGFTDTASARVTRPATPADKSTKTAAAPRAETEPRLRLVPPARPLRELSPNKPVSSRAVEAPKAAPERNPDRRIRSLAEDQPLGAVSKPDQAKTPSRLDALLNTPSSKLGSKTTSQSAPRPRLQRDMDDSLVPNRRSLPWGTDNGQQRAGPKRRTPASGSGGTTKPHDKDGTNLNKRPQGRLRNKPQSELKLDDFRVNPRFNTGENFAFSEVVRDRDERANLPGCTDPNCCGRDFRALALAERPPLPLSAAQRAEENQLLQEYLGDSAYRIPTLSPGERDELWLEAKTRQLANRFARHKHRFHRAASPPGFWNADFPTTQEMQEERNKAHQRERDMVTERYREAMRPDGRWLFRDE